ncbi:MAG: hypothetical protein IT345_09740, partial [Trueperaceae bacterium]|nr:hypothetical protein [Trueperaceae bacterium]
MVWTRFGQIAGGSPEGAAAAAAVSAQSVPDAWIGGAAVARRGADHSVARDLVLRHGWNTTVYQVLNPDILHWFTPAGDALVGYVQHA